MVARSTFFGNGFFSSDIVLEDAYVKCSFPLIHEKAEALRQSLLKFCSITKPGMVVVGKFLLKENLNTEYVCSLFEEEDYQRRLVFIKNHPHIFSFLRFLLKEPELATVTAVWDSKGNLNPNLYFRITNSSYLKEEKIKKEFARG